MTAKASLTFLFIKLSRNGTLLNINDKSGPEGRLGERIYQ